MLTGSHESRRRGAALLAMAIATIATVATSPGAPSIESRVTGRATLDSANPVLTQGVAIRLTAEAVAPETAYGGAALSVDADGLGNELRDGGLDPSVRVTVVPEDPALLPESVPTRDDGGRFFSVDSCARGEPCEAQYTIVIEWREPDRGESVTVEWEIEARVGFERAVPQGAEIEVIHLGDPVILSEPPPDLVPRLSPPPTSPLPTPS